MRFFNVHWLFQTSCCRLLSQQQYVLLNLKLCALIVILWVNGCQPNTYRSLIFKQSHIIATQGTHKQNTCEIIETVDPLSSLWSRTSYVHYPGVHDRIYISYIYYIKYITFTAQEIRHYYLLCWVVSSINTKLVCIQAWHLNTFRFQFLGAWSLEHKNEVIDKQLFGHEQMVW